jgi:hypothetical protein
MFRPDVTGIPELRSFQRRKTTLRVFGMISDATRGENRTLVGGSSNIVTARIRKQNGRPAAFLRVTSLREPGDAVSAAGQRRLSFGSHWRIKTGKAWDRNAHQIEALTTR